MQTANDMLRRWLDVPAPPGKTYIEPVTLEPDPAIVAAVFAKPCPRKVPVRNIAGEKARHEHLASTRRSVIDTMKAAAGCARCAESDPCCLDYHHRDPVTKSFSISKVIMNTKFSMDAIPGEITKCDVLCRNCHAKEHHNKRQKVTGNQVDQNHNTVYQAGALS